MIWLSVLLLGEMDVVVDVIHAEAVIPGTARAVAKFKIRIVCVSPPAHGAFMAIGLAGFGALLRLSLFDFSCFLFEVNGVWVYSSKAGAAKAAGKLISAENEKVEYGHKRKKGDCPRPCNAGDEHTIYKECRVNPCKPLHLYRDEKHQKHPLLRIHGGKGEKHGQVQIKCSYIYGCTQSEGENYTVYDVKDDAHGIVYGESSCAPCVFKRRADEIVKVKLNNNPRKIRGRNKCP